MLPVVAQVKGRPENLTKICLLEEAVSRHDPVKFPFLQICFLLQSDISLKRISIPLCANVGKYFYSLAGFVQRNSLDSPPVSSEPSHQGFEGTHTWLSHLERGKGDAKRNNWNGIAIEKNTHFMERKMSKAVVGRAFLLATENTSLLSSAHSD